MQLHYTFSNKLFNLLSSANVMAISDYSLSDGRKKSSSDSQTPVKPLRGNKEPVPKDLLTQATMRSFNYIRAGTLEQKTFGSFVYIHCVLLATT